MIKFPQSEEYPANVKIQIALKNVKEKFEQRKKNQKSISKIVLKVHNLVLLKVPPISKAIDKTVKKFFHLYEGPYRIHKVLDNNAFVLGNIDTKVKGTFNRQSLKSIIVWTKRDNKT